MSRQHKYQHFRHALRDLLGCQQSHGAHLPNFNAGSGGVNTNGQIRFLISGANRLNYNLYRDNYSNFWDL